MAKQQCSHVILCFSTSFYWRTLPRLYGCRGTAVFLRGRVVILCVPMMWWHGMRSEGEVPQLSLRRGTQIRWSRFFCGKKSLATGVVCCRMKGWKALSVFFAPCLWGTKWPQTLHSTKTSAAFAASGNFFATAAKASASSCCFVLPRNKHKSLGWSCWETDMGDVSTPCFCLDFKGSHLSLWRWTAAVPASVVPFVSMANSTELDDEASPSDWWKMVSCFIWKLPHDLENKSKKWVPVWEIADKKNTFWPNSWGW